METVATADNNSGGNPNSIKSDDSSPQHESGRGSPPPKCAICLGTCRNKSFTDSCLHQFCFNCLVTWSKVKAECPLCKQNFKSIIHNVRANNQYEEYMVEQRQTEEDQIRSPLEALANVSRRFRYRTTMTIPRRESLAIQQWLLQYPLSAIPVAPPPHSPPAPLPPAPPPIPRRRRSPASFRRTVYRHNLWARPLPDFTGRYRDCSPEFYRYNYIQTQRLVPWINRELSYLLNDNVGHISYVLSRVLELLPQYHINSNEFREAMRPYFLERTEHFLHELYCFASTPYDLPGYDRHVQYTTDSRISTIVNEIISSSESDASVDSDIVMVTTSYPADPPPGPSRFSTLSGFSQPSFIPPPNLLPPPDNVIPIETISHSDTDDDDDVMVVGYIKPPQERTPEVVDLLGSDSDVIVQDNVQSETVQAPEATESRPAQPLVKLSLKRHAPSEATDSDHSDRSAYTPPTQPSRHRRRRRRSNTPYSHTPPSSSSSTSLTNTSFFTTDSDSDTETVSDTVSDTSTSSWSTSDNRRGKKLTRKVLTKLKTAAEKCKTNLKRSSKSNKNESAKPRAPREKRSKRDTRKSAKKTVKTDSNRSERNTTMADIEQQPSTSGVNKRKDSRDGKRRRVSRESTRLRSVVNVMNKNTVDTNSCSSNSNLLNIVSRAVLNPRSAYNSDSGSIPPDERTSIVPSGILKEAESCFDLNLPASTQTSDSDDDRPLNLTVKKTLNKQADERNYESRSDSRTPQ